MANFAGFITISPKRAIGTLTAAVTVEEVHTDELVITEHPVEAGASITDHAYKKPSEVLIRCGWSNSDLAALGLDLSELGDVFAGTFTGTDYVSKIYQQLLDLQVSRVPFDVTTGKRQYQNMLLRSLSVTTDAKTENVLTVTAACREIIIVSTQATTLPPRSAMAAPEITAPISLGGVKQAIPAAPALTGSFNP